MILALFILTLGIALLAQWHVKRVYARHSRKAAVGCPGPDIHAEGRDHTLAAVWLKVTNSLHRQIQQRKNQQLLSLKSKGAIENS